jgi:hypothetical protein
MTPTEIVASYSDEVLFGILGTKTTIDCRDASWLEKRKQLARDEIYRRENQQERSQQ